MIENCILDVFLMFPNTLYKILQISEVLIQILTNFFSSFQVHNPLVFFHLSLNA